MDDGVSLLGASAGFVIADAMSRDLVTDPVYKLQAAPGADTETEEDVQRLNDQIQGGPDEESGETWAEWYGTLLGIIDDLHGPNWYTGEVVPVGDGSCRPYAVDCGTLPRFKGTCTVSAEARSDADAICSFGDFPEWQWSDDEQEFIIEAVAHMRRHLDLIESLVCVYFGPDSSAWTNLSAFLSGDAGTIDFRKATDNNCAEPGTDAYMYVDGGAVRREFTLGRADNVYVCDTVWNDIFPWYQCGTDADKLSAALWVGSMIVHELLHLSAGVGHGDEYEVNEGCDRVNSFSDDFEAALTSRCGVFVAPFPSVKDCR